MKILKVVTLIFLAIVFVGCTANERAKQFGGTMDVAVPKGQEFVNVTWKDNDLWVLTKNETAGHVPTTYTFKANTSYGVFEGKVIIREQ